MADRSPYDRPHQLIVHPQHTGHEAGFKSLLPRNGPTKSQILAVVTLLPVGGTLLCLAGISFALSMIGLVITFPLFVICSPVIVPALITIALAVTGFLSSGALGLSGVTSLSWVLGYFRRAADAVPEQLEQAKKKAQDLAITAGQKTKDVGQMIQTKAQDAGKEGAKTT